MPTMYARTLAPPKASFFLFGPRATGKTTWLRSALPEAFWVDLFDERKKLEFMRDPGRFYDDVRASNRPWVVVDEVQALPWVLNEVHRLIEEKRHRFALSGSSARKLRRGHANLLAGRATVSEFFPLTWRETGGAATALKQMLEWGALPAVFDAADDAARAETLDAYARTYLMEEVKAEALVRNLSSFVRFIECASRLNAQVVNVSSLSRDAGVQRTTVQGYFEILQDTLLGSFLEGWRGHARVKEQSHPKFYFFDSGVTRALANRLDEPVVDATRGALFETQVLHELRAHASYAKLRGKFFYWRTPSGTEVDFVWQHGDDLTILEVKSAARWRREDSKGLKAFLEGKKARAFGVYRGRDRLVADGIEVLPVESFLEQLYAGRIIR